MTSEDLFASISKPLLAGGGSAAIVDGLFQFFGRRWPDNRFARQQSGIAGTSPQSLSAASELHELACRTEGVHVSPPWR